tara:strand:- start:47 stop:637 length:591 start_codon:yes stop_codon:yes gene_type:complete
MNTITNTTKALWDLDELKLVSYPRNDDEPVIGLDTSRYVTLNLIRNPQPEYNPIEEYLISNTTLDLDLLTYTYGWLVEKMPLPGPDYKSFYSALLISDCYQAVLAEVLSTTSPAPAGALAVFVSAMQDCLNNRVNVNAMQSAIWLLLGQLNLDTVYLVELQTMLTNAHLDQFYSLQPPELTTTELTPPELFLETEN